MVDVDELLRRELHLVAEPGDPAGVAERVRARGGRLARRRQAGRVALVVGVMGAFAVVGLFLARGLAGLARGSGPRPVNGGVPGTAATSPIVFSAPDPADPSRRGLLLLNPATGATSLVPGTGDLSPLEPSWSPDGTRIAFSTEAEPRIQVMNADGSDVHGITTFGIQPQWSPDGSRIAFESFPEGSGPGHLFVVNVDGTGLHDLGPGRGPDWSPDGGQIVFATDADRLEVMDADGTGVRALGVEGVSPDWSPDGRTIAFSRDDGIYTVRPDGSDLTKLTSGPGRYDDPSWSPDGTMIAFSKDAGPIETECAGGSGCYVAVEEVWLMDADGGHARQLTHLASREHPNSGAAPAWAPVSMPLP